jgi:hypothetical protein
VTHLALRQRFSFAAEPPALQRFLEEALVHLRDGPRTSEVVRHHRAVLREDGLLEVWNAGFPAEPLPLTPGLARLMSSINVAAVASVDHLPVLHASAASWAGRAIVVPGRPGAGKSTLVAGLVAAGCGYLTDEAVPIDGSAHAVPYPKPIVVGPGSWPALAHARAGRVELARGHLDAWYLDPARLGVTVETAPLPVGMVVVPRYRPGSPTLIEPLTPAEATAAMSSNTFNQVRHGRSGIERCADVARAARCVQLTHGDLRDACARLVELAST